MGISCTIVFVALQTNFFRPKKWGLSGRPHFWHRFKFEIDPSSNLKLTLSVCSRRKFKFEIDPTSNFNFALNLVYPIVDLTHTLVCY